MVEQVLGTLVMAWPRAGPGTQFHSNYCSCRKALTCQPPASSEGQLVGLGPEPPVWAPCAGPLPTGPLWEDHGLWGELCPSGDAPHHLPSPSWLGYQPFLNGSGHPHRSRPPGLQLSEPTSTLEVTESVPSKHGCEPCEGLLTPREQI